MSEPLLPDSVRRVEIDAATKGLPVRIVRTETIARTAQEAAQAVGAQVSQIVKSLVFRGRTSGDAILLLIAGDRRVDERKAAAFAGEPIERPDAAFVREATGFAIGGVSPLGSLKPLRIAIDAGLLEEEVVWAAAGSPYHVFEARPAMLAEAVQASVSDLTEAATPG